MRQECTTRDSHTIASQRHGRELAMLGAVLVLAACVSAITGCSSGGGSNFTSAPDAVSTGAVEGRPAGGAPGAGNADTSAITTKYLDVTYANESAAQKLDIYLPESGEGPFPVIISIHGGAFLMGDKADGQLTPMLSGLDRGYAVVSINYRLSDEALAPAQINDVKAAIRFLRANAEEYNLDPTRFAAWGGSAGGNLAALAGTSAGVDALADQSLGNAAQSDAVQAVVDWFGPIDFATMDSQFTASGTGPANHGAADSPESKLVGAPLADVPGAVQAANPTTYITNDDPPFLIEHGDADANVPVEQSEDFAAALIKTLGGEKITLEILPGAGHADAAFMSEANVSLVLDWLDSNLK